ncbi:GNAT family N-acetyltransferase [Burkholderiaceae bacterium DAT-1]|nr:GNAT family N-acetyltransferase [Burkholderiaceae bacterium DAT-1]
MSDTGLYLFESARLGFRELSRLDAGFILEHVNEPAFIQNIGDKNVHSLDDAWTYIQNGPGASYAANGFGLYRVALLEDDTPIGMCGLVKRDGLDTPDIGYAYLQRYWGKGYALEAGQAVLNYARQTLKIPRIVGITGPDNLGSQRVLEKLGLHYQATITLPGRDDLSMLFVPEPQRAGTGSPFDLSR